MCVPAVTDRLPLFSRFRRFDEPILNSGAGGPFRFAGASWFSTVRYNEPAPQRRPHMIRSNEFLNVALLTALFIGVALASRLF